MACAVTGPVWGNLVDSGASRKFLLQEPGFPPMGFVCEDQGSSGPACKHLLLFTGQIARKLQAPPQ